MSICIHYFCSIAFSFHICNALKRFHSALPGVQAQTEEVEPRGLIVHCTRISSKVVCSRCALGSGSRFVNILRGMVKLVIYMTSVVHQVKLESFSYLRSVGWHIDSAKSIRARTRALVVAFNGCRLTISIHSNWMDAAWLSHTTTTEARKRS